MYHRNAIVCRNIHILSYSSVPRVSPLAHRNLKQFATIHPLPPLAAGKGRGEGEKCFP